MACTAGVLTRLSRGANPLGAFLRRASAGAWRQGAGKSADVSTLPRGALGSLGSCDFSRDAVHPGSILRDAARPDAGFHVLASARDYDNRDGAGDHRHAPGAGRGAGLDEQRGASAGRSPPGGKGGPVNGGKDEEAQGNAPADGGDDDEGDDDDDDEEGRDKDVEDEDGDDDGDEDWDELEAAAREAEAVDKARAEEHRDNLEVARVWREHAERLRERQVLQREWLQYLDNGEDIVRKRKGDVWPASKFEFMSPTEKAEKGLFHASIVHVNRSTKVIKSGSTCSYRAMVVVGNKAGLLGYGTGKAKEPQDAIERAYLHAVNAVNYYDRYERHTLPRRVEASFVCTKVMLKPMPYGSGVRACRIIEDIMALLGVEDLTTKVIGSKNPFNIVRATFKALDKAISIERESTARGVMLVPSENLVLSAAKP